MSGEERSFSRDFGFESEGESADEAMCLPEASPARSSPKRASQAEQLGKPPGVVYRNPQSDQFRGCPPLEPLGPPPVALGWMSDEERRPMFGAVPRKKTATPEREAVEGGGDFAVTDEALKKVFPSKKRQQARRHYKRVKLLEAQGGPLTPPMMAEMSALLGVSSTTFDDAMIGALARFQYQRGFSPREVDARLSPTPTSKTWRALAVEAPSFRVGLTAAEDAAETPLIEGEGDWTPETLEAMANGEDEKGQLKAAVDYNNQSGFRVDWVRSMQRFLFDVEEIAVFEEDAGELSMDGRFDKRTVLEIARFQRDEGLHISGRVDPVTFRVLQGRSSALKNPLLGVFLEPDVLVPASAPERARYHYYRQVIMGGGGAFSHEVGQVNILAIRGAEVLGGGPYEVRQRPTAKGHAEIQARLRAGEAPTPEALALPEAQHFWAKDEDEAAFDDLFVTLSRSLGEDGEERYRVREHIGSVDPNLEGESQGRGAAHLSDGQYIYALLDGERGHSTSHHNPTLSRLAQTKEGASLLDLHPRGKRMSYASMRPARGVESRRQDIREEDGVWTPREEAVNDRLISERDESRVDGPDDLGVDRDGKKTRHKGDNINHNLHTAHDGAKDDEGNHRRFKLTDGEVIDQVGVSSAGCMNVHASEYLELLETLKGAENGPHVDAKKPAEAPADSKKFADAPMFYFTLIDASKIALRLEEMS